MSSGRGTGLDEGNGCVKGSFTGPSGFVGSSGEGTEDSEDWADGAVEAVVEAAVVGSVPGVKKPLLEEVWMPFEDSEMDRSCTETSKCFDEAMSTDERTEEFWFLNGVRRVQRKPGG